MSQKSMKQLTAEAREIAEACVTTKEKLIEALPVYAALKRAYDNAKLLTNRVNEALKELSRQCSEYVLAHSSVFDEGLAEKRTNIHSGDITLDDVVYHFTSSPGDYKRKDGSNITATFLAGLPAAFRKTRVELDKSAIDDANLTESELLGYGLVQKTKNEWSIVEKR